MSVKLIVEVLDHYHGPHARKLWLIAWAEKVTGDSRAGYCKREVLVARLGRSASRVSGIARELEDEGTIKRLGGGHWGKAAVYELLPLAPAQGQPRTDPIQGQPRADPTAEPGMHAQGQPRTDAQGQPRADPNPDNPEKPSSSSRRTTRTGSSGRPAATDDDDSGVRPLTRAARDPRTLLLGLDVDERLIEHILGWLDDHADDPFAYLLAIIGKHPDAEGGIRDFLDRRRRDLDALDGYAEDAPAAADDDRPRLGYGLCPECGDRQIVKASGGCIGRHDADVGGRSSWCPGSGRPPVEPVPCVRCERTDVALNGYGLCRACREAIKAAEGAEP